MKGDVLAVRRPRGGTAAGSCHHRLPDRFRRKARESPLDYRVNWRTQSWIPAQNHLLTGFDLRQPSEWRRPEVVELPISLALAWCPPYRELFFSQEPSCEPVNSHGGYLFSAPAGNSPLHIFYLRGPKCWRKGQTWPATNWPALAHRALFGCWGRGFALECIQRYWAFFHVRGHPTRSFRTAAVFCRG